MISVLFLRATDDDPFELLDVLRVLGEEKVAGMTWGVSGLGCMSNVTAEIVEELNVPGSRKLFSGQGLLTLSHDCFQVIEGEFVGYSSEEEAAECLQPGWYLSWFAQSQAAIGIRVDDGAIYIFYLRSQADIDKLKQRFKTIEDLDNYL